MAIDYKEIGSNIKVCRIRKNLKQAQLAEIVGVSSQHISHIECGKMQRQINSPSACQFAVQLWNTGKEA